MEVARRLNTNIFLDHRGSFSPLSLKTLDKEWLQSNISVNPKKHTLRGLHYQKGEFAQAKLIKVINGRILDFVYDMREHSNDGVVDFFEMNAGDEIIVPRGYAHGFITLEDNTIVQYLVDNVYEPKSECSMVWNVFDSIKDKIKEIDSTFNVDNVIISDKDLINKF